MTNPTEPEPKTETETATIDALLAHYLSLLDEYTTLRAALNTLQAGLYQHLARANFSAERGVRRYGRDYYDERMQASRRVCISSGESSGGGGAGSGGGGAGSGGGGSSGCAGTEGGAGSGGVREGGEKGGEDTGNAVFSVAVYPPPSNATNEEDGEKEDGSDASSSNDNNNNHSKQTKAGTTTPPPAHAGEKPAAKDTEPTSEEDDDSNEQKEKDNTKNEKQAPNNNPLRWFGILTPLPLRQAQAQAITAVEEMIPRLATLSAEMAAVELAVRRARKRRGKLEKAEEKRRVGEAGGGEKKVVELEEEMGKVGVA